MRPWLTFVLLLLAAPALADRIHESGFESNTGFATTDEWTAYANTANMSYVASPLHSGSYTLRVNASAANSYAQWNLPADDTSGTYFMRLYWRAAEWPQNGQGIFSTQSNTGTTSQEIRFVSATPTLEVFNNASTPTGTATCGNTISLNTWYRLELRVIVSDTVGEVQFKVFTGESTTADCDVSIGAANTDTLSTGYRRFRYGDDTNDTYDVFYDDTCINDETGSFQTSWCGPGYIALLTTASDDAAGTPWTNSGANCSGTTDEDCVDEIPGAAADDVSGYIASPTTANQIERFNKGSLAESIAADSDMVLVHLYGRVGGASNSGTRTMRLKLWDEAGTGTNGPGNPSSLGCDVAATWAVVQPSYDLVFDLGTRSKADVNDADFDIGVENTTAHECRATALWANVEYKDAPAAPSCTAGLNLPLVGVGGCP